jgi:hypothetical protein
VAAHPTGGRQLRLNLIHKVAKGGGRLCRHREQRRRVNDDRYRCSGLGFCRSPTCARFTMLGRATFQIHCGVGPASAPAAGSTTRAEVIAGADTVAIGARAGAKAASSSRAIGSVV